MVAETFLHDLVVDASLANHKRRVRMAKILKGSDAGEAAGEYELAQGRGDVVGMPGVAVWPGEDQCLLGRNPPTPRSCSRPLITCPPLRRRRSWSDGVVLPSA